MIERPEQNEWKGKLQYLAKSSGLSNLLYSLSCLLKSIMYTIVSVLTQVQFGLN